MRACALECEKSQFAVCKWANIFGNLLLLPRNWQRLLLLLLPHPHAHPLVQPPVGQRQCWPSPVSFTHPPRPSVRCSGIFGRYIRKLFYLLLIAVHKMPASCRLRATPFIEAHKAINLKRPPRSDQSDHPPTPSPQPQPKTNVQLTNSTSIRRQLLTAAIFWGLAAMCVSVCVCVHPCVCVCICVSWHVALLSTFALPKWTNRKRKSPAFKLHWEKCMPIAISWN